MVDIPNGFEVVYMVQLYGVPDQQNNDPETLTALQNNHLAHIRHLAEIGHLLVAGPCPTTPNDLRGLLIIRANDEAQTRELIEEDPAIKANRLRAEIIPWMIEKDSIPAPSLQK